MDEIVDEIRRRLADLFEPRQINRWLETPCAFLGDETPLALMAAGRGEEVLKLLDQVASG